MGFKFTLVNIILFLSYISPVLLGFFMVMTSAFNQDMKGVIYLIGVIVVTSIGIILRNMFKIEGHTHPICNLIDIPGANSGGYTTPVFSTLIVAFTFIYLGFPMFENGANVPVLISLSTLLGMDILVNFYHNCYGDRSVFNLLISTVFGATLGIGYYYLVNLITDGKQTYFSDLPSNQVVCRKPKAETYKCRVYKNGRLLKTL